MSGGHPEQAGLSRSERLDGSGVEGGQEQERPCRGSSGPGVRGLLEQGLNCVPDAQVVAPLEHPLCGASHPLWGSWPHPGSCRPKLWTRALAIISGARKSVICFSMGSAWKRLPATESTGSALPPALRAGVAFIVLTCVLRGAAGHYGCPPPCPVPVPVQADLPARGDAVS